MQHAPRPGEILCCRELIADYRASNACSHCRSVEAKPARIRFLRQSSGLRKCRDDLLAKEFDGLLDQLRCQTAEAMLGA